MKIFYFCFEGFSKHGQINNHIRETVSHLARFGHEVHFFIPTITKPEFAAPVKIQRIPIINLPLIRWLTFEPLAFLVLLLKAIQHRPNHLYFRETSSFIPLLISKIFSIPLTIEVNGWVLEELRQTDYTRWKLTYMRLNQRLNFRHCWRIIPVTEGLKQLLIDAYHLPDSKIFPVANGTNPIVFRPIPRGEAFKITGLPDNRFTIGFIGSCYHYHGVQYLIKAAPFIIEKQPDVQFIVVGDGAQLAEWKQLVREMHLDDYFIFTGKVPFQQAPYYINCFDIAVAPWDVAFFNRISGSPMKTFDYMACGKPFIASPVREVACLVEKHQCGVILDVNNPIVFSNGIFNLMKAEYQRQKMGENGRQAVIQFYTWERTTRNIEKILSTR